MKTLKEDLKRFNIQLKKIDRKRIFHNLDLGLQIIRRVVLNLFAWGILAFGLFLGIGMGYVASIINREEIPSVAEMDQLIHDVNQNSTLYYADNSTLGEIKSNIVCYKVNSQDISPWVKKAIVASEDEDFYQHSGIMPRAVLRAGLADVFGLGTRNGGSTLTQQLVKMQILSSETTFKRKATEIFLAMRVNQFFTKDDVLTSYLNAASFGRNNKGENISGIGAASLGIFGKKPSDLSIAQAAFIVGLVQSPYAYTPFGLDGKINQSTLKYGLRRSQIVLFRMYRDGKLTTLQYRKAQQENIQKALLPAANAKRKVVNSDYAYNAVQEEARTILTEVLMKDDDLNPDNVNDLTYQRYSSMASLKLSQNGYKIYSTLNQKLNHNLNEVLVNARDLFGETHTDEIYDQNENKFVELKEPVQNGTVILDNHSGAILGFTGGVDFSLSEFNHAFSNRRSPGSSIKPLIAFAPAIDQGIIGSRSVLADFPAKYGGYTPSDYGQTFQNRFVSATEALAQSYNVATINLYQKLREKDSNSAKNYLEKMDLKLTPQEYNELGVSLGGVKHGFSPLQEAAAYATFANDGEYQRPFLIAKIIDPTGRVVYEHKEKTQRVFSNATAYIIRKMLGEVVKDGTATYLGNNLEFDSGKLYGKTGTSNDNRDYWFTGSTPGITVSSWIGYDNLYGHSYNLSQTDTNSNLRLVARILNNIYEQQPDILKLNENKAKPNNVKEYTVLKSTGTFPGSLNTGSNSLTIRGNLVTNLYAQGSPKNLTPNFGVGGYASDYRLFWSNYFGQNNGYGQVSTVSYNMKYDTSNSDVYFSFYETPRGYSPENSGYFEFNNQQQYGNRNGNWGGFSNDRREAQGRDNQSGNSGQSTTNSEQGQNQNNYQYNGQSQPNNGDSSTQDNGNNP